MITIRFMTLTPGEFKTAREETFVNLKSATAAIIEYATAGGYTEIKVIDDGEYGDLRFTGCTPNGRAGRNVAYASLISEGY